MSTFLRPQQTKRVVITVPRAIAQDAEFEIRITNEAYDEMAITIKQDGKKVATVTRKGEVVVHDA